MKKRTMMSKLLAVVLATSMVLAGCGSTQAKSTAGTTTETAAASAEAETQATSTQATGEPIKVGASFPLSGTVAADGKYIVDAIQLAADKYNAAGGINGRQIEIEAEDDEANPTTAASVANKFAEDSDIMAVLTSYNSSCALAQIPVYKEAGLSAISPVSTNPSITGMSDYYYRTCNSDSYVGALCAENIQKLGWKKIAVLYEQDDYGYGIFDTFTKKAEELGIETAYTGTFVYGETKDFSTILSSIKEADVDGIYFIGLVTEMGLMANQASTFGVEDVPVFADEGCYSPAMIEEGGAAVNNLYSLGAFSSDSDEEVVATFVSDFNAAYGEDPSNWAALAYDAACTVFEAMKSCDTIDRESINNALQTIEYQGVTGLNKFENSDVSKEYSIFQIQDGAWVKVEL